MPADEQSQLLKGPRTAATDAIAYGSYSFWNAGCVWYARWNARHATHDARRNAGNESRRLFAAKSIHQSAASTVAVATIPVAAASTTTAPRATAARP